MVEPLDLSILLDSPPPDSPPEVIAGIALQCGSLGLSHSGNMLQDPLTGKERDDLRWYLEEYWKWPYLEFAARGKQAEALLHAVGKRLYQAVLGGREAQALLHSWQAQSGVHRQISIVSALPHVLSLPWELLHDDHGFLALHPDHPTSIVRRLPLREQHPPSAPLAPPLRILLVTARPEGAGFVDPRSISHTLQEELQAQIDRGAIDLEFLRPPTLAALRDRLRDAANPIHVLHFDGHGVFDGEEFGQGVLLFETVGGLPSPVKASDLAKVLRDRGVRLAVLTACQSAKSSPEDALSSVAAQLIQGGMDAVVAMGESFLVASAARYAEALYHALASGASMQLAQERARQALHDDPRRHLHRRRRDEEGLPVEVYDWWIPQYYQQHSLDQQSTMRSRETDPAAQRPSSPRFNEAMPSEPRYGFNGRTRELLQLERALLRGKLVAIHGFGGAGKTTLAREAADWFTRTNMFDCACFVSFEHGGDAALLLSVLGNFLGVNDGGFDPGDREAALARLELALKRRLVLMVIDNVEGNFAGGEAPLEEEARAQLWDLLLQLSVLGAGIVLTSRSPLTDVGVLAQGKRVAQLALGGLHPEDAYVLATRLLSDLGIDQECAPYTELRDLLKQLDYHPLAIQLVLPTLRELELASIRTDFSELLSKFKDDAVSGRNGSLSASLHYSLQRLSGEQRELLFHLAPFEGGAREISLLAITGIPESKWVHLRLSLEQAGLLEVARVHESIADLFLHFHPVLIPYLRGQTVVDDAALRERYMEYYQNLAGYLAVADIDHPLPIRALAWRELPNLRRVLRMLLHAGQLEAASKTAGPVSRFLTLFGLVRECDELRQQIAAATSASGARQDRQLSHVEWLREKDLGDDELVKGKPAAAYARFTSLLERIEESPEGSPRGYGSYEHCLALNALARCLRALGRPAAAELPVRQALSLFDSLVARELDLDTHFVAHQRRIFLDELFSSLRDQGKYEEAGEVNLEAMQLAQKVNDQRGLLLTLLQLGGLFQELHLYEKAKEVYVAALGLTRQLEEPASEAVTWYRLGMIAEGQRDWERAEYCYRQSLTLDEFLGNEDGVADTCNQLGIVTKSAGRRAEAERWYKRAEAIDAQIHPNSAEHAHSLHNLAQLLANDVKNGRIPRERLAEAKQYAERALAIREKLEASSQVWTTLYILAFIAELKGQAEEARLYHRRERETYAAFAGNRHAIDQRYELFIVDVARAAQGDVRARLRIQGILLEAEARGWPIAALIHRIWAGERDWQALVEDLEGKDALLVLRILEILTQFSQTQPVRASDSALEVALDLFPHSVRQALEQNDALAYEEAFQALLPEEQDASIVTAHYLRIRSLEPLLQIIAAVAVGKGDQRREIEGELDELETLGFHLKEAMHGIWAGERDTAVLTRGLDEQDAILVQQVLEIVKEFERDR